jgi:hypothetical protein
MPLILSHGWPGSVLEYLELIDRLTDPLAHGGQAGDAVHAWDVAAGLGLPPALTPRLAGQLLPAVRAIAEPLRQFGAYAPALAPEAGDDALADPT